MEGEIYALAGKYGFKAVHDGLHSIMRREYESLTAILLPGLAPGPVPVPIASPVAAPIPVPLAKAVKARKQRVKKGALPVPVPVQNEVVSLSLPTPDTVEIKDVIVNMADKSGFRDPKEMREFQKAGEEAKRKENEAAGIQLFQILTKENLKKWIEDEGHTYAWVAREKAGCADTQVAAQAQMMGIKSKISKKRGMIIAGK